ncbi:MAG: COQ9 family protein [Alphaproteobacteria bacterium]|nr:COQ9 family protein [Alphaproteobacteria bacterium]
MTRENKSLEAVKNKLMAQALKSVGRVGWNGLDIQKLSTETGYPPEMAEAVFPAGVADMADYYSRKLDAEMLESLEDVDPKDLKTRERVATAVMARYRAAAEDKDIFRQTLAFWSSPNRLPRGGKILWRTADIIWQWAGDTATDYNHYTKRALLGGVITSTNLVFINDTGGTLTDTEDFLKRRIENVLKIGSLAGSIISKVKR